MRDPAIASAMRALEQKGPRLRQLSTRGSTTSDLAWDTAQWRDVAVQPFKYSCADMVVRHLCLLTFLGLPVVAVLTHYEIFRPKMGQIGGQVAPLAIYEHPRVSPAPQ